MLTHRTGRVAVVQTEPSIEQAFAGMPTENYRASYRAMLAAADPSLTADVEAMVRALREVAVFLDPERPATCEDGLIARCIRANVVAALANWTETNDG